MKAVSALLAFLCLACVANAQASVAFSTCQVEVDACNHPTDIKGTGTWNIGGTSVPLSIGMECQEYYFECGEPVFSGKSCTTTCAVVGSGSGTWSGKTSANTHGDLPRHGFYYLVTVHMTYTGGFKDDTWTTSLIYYP